MTHRVARWIDGLDELAVGRSNPRIEGHNYPDREDVVGLALRDAATKLWKDLWESAHSPCPNCGHKKS